MCFEIANYVLGGCIKLLLRNCALGNKSINIIVVAELIYFDEFYLGYELIILEEGKIKTGFSVSLCLL